MTLDTRDIHSDIELQLVDRRVRFLNGGFPVNFDGSDECIPAEQIQITRALMVAAAAQAVTCQDRGVMALDNELCDWLDERYLALL